MPKISNSAHWFLKKKHLLKVAIAPIGFCNRLCWAVLLDSCWILTSKIQTFKQTLEILKAKLKTAYKVLPLTCLREQYVRRMAKLVSAPNQNSFQIIKYSGERAVKSRHISSLSPRSLHPVASEEGYGGVTFPPTMTLDQSFLWQKAAVLSATKGTLRFLPCIDLRTHRVSAARQRSHKSCSHVFTEFPSSVKVVFFFPLTWSLFHVSHQDKNTK